MYDTSRLDATRYHKILFEWSYPTLAIEYQKKGGNYPSLGENGEIIR